MLELVPALYSAAIIIHTKGTAVSDTMGETEKQLGQCCHVNLFQATLGMFFCRLYIDSFGMFFFLLVYKV